MTSEELKEEVLKNKDESLEDMIYMLLNIDDNIDFDDCEECGNDIEICFTNKDIGIATIHVFLDEEVIEDEELFEEILDNCKCQEFGGLIEHEISYYVIVNDDNEEISGYKEFGFTDEEWRKLISR